MAWTRIDDKFLMNPKVQSVGVHGMALYLAGLIYCNSNLTDGYIASSVLPMICGMAYQTPARKIVDRLVDANLWERFDGGYQIHDFLIFNKSKQEIALLNKQRANNGAKGGRPAKQMETELLTNLESKPVSKQPPIIPNTLIPNTLNPKTNKELPLPPDARDVLVGKIFKTYEHEIGIITSAIADDIKGAIDDYPIEWFEDAFKEAARNNKRNWSYALAILKRWKADGFKVDTRSRPPERGGNTRAGIGNKTSGNDLDTFRKLWEKEHE